MGGAKRHPSMPALCAQLVARMSEAISGAVLEWSRMSLRSSGLRTNIIPPSRGAVRPRFASSLPSSSIRGRREDRVRAAPAVSRAIAHRRRAHEHTGSAGASRPSLRNGFTAYFELSPVNGSFATVIGWILPANLTPAPRRQDHTTSPYASATLVSHGIRVHRISPHVRDDGQRPSSAARRA